VRWAGVVARLVLGVVWVVAGALKLGDPAENVRAVRAYDLLPESLVQVVGHALPVVEIVVGLCLLLGLLTRWAALVSGLLLLGFVVGISAAWARGMSIECGCFGGGGGRAAGASDKYPWELARDVVLLLLSAYLVVRPRTPYSVDARLLPEASTSVPPTVARRTRSSQHAAELRHAAAVQEQQRRNRAVTMVVAVALLVVVGFGFAVQSNRDLTGDGSATPAGVVNRYALPVGATRPTVVVDIYEDFMCPFCGQFEAAAKSLTTKYADQPVQFRYHVIAFLDQASSSRYSTRATNALAVVLDSAGAEAAKKFHDELYAAQPAEGSAGLTDEKLIALAVAAGAQRSAVEQPIRSLEFAGWVRNATDAASKSGVNATPTIVVDGKPLPPEAIDATVATLERTIDNNLDS